MRIIRLDDFKPLSQKRKKQKWLRVSACLVLAGGLVIGLAVGIRHYKKSTTPVVRAAPQAERFRQLTDEEFTALAFGVEHANVQGFGEPPAITGNAPADAYIRTLAEARGYGLTGLPTGPLANVHESNVDGEALLQPQAAVAWQDLKAAAQQNGIPLTLVAAFRSPDLQRDVFMKRLLARGVSPQQIAAGQADGALESTLELTAPPGYSRHHTGYTISLVCQTNSPNFLKSPCHAWLSANNYEKAKLFGWIPSSPAGTISRGPAPEPGELTWVGTDLLTNQ